jgi:hypothetical protein
MGINDFREKIIVGEKNYCRGLNHCAMGEMTVLEASD